MLWKRTLAGVGKMNYSEDEKRSDQGMMSVDCGFGVTVKWKPAAYRSIDEIYDEVISECHDQSCLMRMSEHRFNHDSNYTDDDIMRQRTLINGYGEYARLCVNDSNDKLIAPHDGEKIAIIGEARHYNPKTFGTQWRVRLEDGTMTVAFFDEIEHLD